MQPTGLTAVNGLTALSSTLAVALFAVTIVSVTLGLVICKHTKVKRKHQQEVNQTLAI